MPIDTPQRPRLTLRLAGSTPSAAEPPAPTPPPEPATPAAAPAKSGRRLFKLTDAELAERVATLARAREMFPAVFGDEPKPLALRTGAKLRDALGVSNQAIDLMMVWWVTRPSYARAVAAPDSKRWNLDGTVFKATVVLEASDVARIKIRNSVPRVMLHVEVSGRVLSADLNAKSLRKCITVIEAAGSAGANVILQGKLEGDALMEAGIVATPKTRKPATGEAVAA